MWSYYGLTESPFVDAVDVRMFYLSDQHRAVLAKTLYCLTERQPLAVITGPFGTGKSLVLSHLNRLLRDQEAFRVVHIQNPASYPTESAFLQKIALELGLPLRRGKGRQMSDLLAASIREAEAGRQVVLIVDEAQNLGKNVGANHLELLRELSNFDAGRKLVTSVLVGQPELHARLAHNKALESRVAIRAALAPLSAESTQALIEHRVSVAGRDEPLFTEEAYAEIHRLSGGLPRRVAQLCWNAVPIAYAAGAAVIPASAIAEAAESAWGVQLPEAAHA